jgi:protein SCO1
MTVIKAASLVLAALLLGAIAPARAHSLAQLDAQLERQEKFFQPVDRPAPDFSLQDADGHPWDMGTLKEKVIVLNFIYAGCKDLCPLHSELIARIQKMVNLTPMRDQVQFISITTDPARDTSEVLKAYGPAHGLDGANWTFLTTRAGQSEDATRKLAEQFGHKFTREEDGEFAHGIVTHVIDREGRLRGNFHGLDFDPTNLVTFVNALVNDVHKPGQAEDQPGMVTAGSSRAPAAPALPLVPIVLALAVAWLVGTTAFFALRRRRLNARSSMPGGKGHGNAGDSAG